VINLPTQSFGTTVFNGLHHAPVRRREAILKASAVSRPMETEDIGQLEARRFFEALISPPSGDGSAG
jgi:hypothetical protein